MRARGPFAKQRGLGVALEEHAAPALHLSSTNVVRLGADLAPCVSELTSRLSFTHPDADATTALDGLRAYVRASAAAVWLIDPTHAHRVLHIGSGDEGTLVALGAHSVARDRLLRHRVLLCRRGKPSGLEDLVRADVRSSVAVAAVGHGELRGVLVLEWAVADAVCDETGAPFLQIAAALFTKALSAAGPGATVLAAQDAERSRIARDLHDEVGQRLVLLSLRLAAVARRDSRAKMQAGVDEAQTDVREIAASIHKLVYQLHPAKLKLLGLTRTLAALCRDVSRESGLDVAFAASGIDAALPEDTALCMFRVAQEALQNAVKHSGGQAIDVSLSEVGGNLVLRVVDDGMGFAAMAQPTAGLGLQSMRERVELLGGRLMIVRAQPHGTLIAAVIPMPADNGADTQAPTRGFAAARRGASRYGNGASMRRRQRR